MQRNDQRWRTWSVRRYGPGIASALFATVACGHPWPLRSDELIGSVIIAAGTLTAWHLGLWPTLVLCGLWGAIDKATGGGEGVRFAELGIRYLVLAGLVVWISQLKSRLETESRLARIDTLTGLPNRQAFEERCSVELSRAKRFRRPMTLVLLDGDRFKEINDRQGHMAGDRALQAVARILAASTRGYDFVGRLGGDEFVLILPETGPDGAATALGRLQQKLHAELERTIAPLTFCMGGVTFFPDERTVGSCLEETDRILYLAKRAGPGALRLASAADAGREERHPEC